MSNTQGPSVQFFETCEELQASGWDQGVRRDGSGPYMDRGWSGQDEIDTYALNTHLDLEGLGHVGVPEKPKPKRAKRKSKKKS